MLTRLIFVPIALCTLSAAVFADDLIGQASVIDGDTIEMTWHPNSYIRN